MKNHKVTLAIMSILMISFSLSVNLQNCQAVPAPAPEATTVLFQSFLTDIMGVNLTEYNITKPGYGISYPSNLGGKIKEETISYQLVSGQGNLSTWCIIEDGVITSCSLRPIEGQTFFTYNKNINDSVNNFLQNYLTFVSQTKKSTAYLTPVISSITNDFDYQKESETTIEGIKLTVKQTDYATNIQWTYVQEGVDITRKSILIGFINGSVSRFADTWNLYSVYDQKTISKEEAQSIGFKAAQAKPINMFSTQDSQPTAVQVTPDWNGWTCKPNLSFIPGAESSQAIGLSNDTSSSVHGDSLTLYPQWHFIFYFGKPIGNVLGVEVGVWADTGEVAYSNVYGHLGGSIIPSTPTASGENTNNFPQILLEYLPAIIVVAIVAVLVGSCILVRKRNRNNK